MPTKEPARVFISYSHHDKHLKDELIKHLSILKRQSVIEAWHDRRISPGDDWRGEIDEHLNTADVILLLVSSDFLASDYCYDVEIQKALQRHESGEARVIPIILRPVDWMGAPFSKLQALPRDGKAITEWSNRDTAFADIARGLRTAVAEPRMAVRPPRYERDALYIERFELTNIRCFDRLNITLTSDDHGEPVDWTVILGDNSTGKTTLLRSLALGLCRESDATFLIKRLPGTFIREGEKAGKITIHLRSRHDNRKYVVTTRILKTPDGNAELIRQATDPERQFPWDNVFVCGYGTHRAGRADASHESYSSRDAVSTLFDSQAALQNPELVMLRQPWELRQRLKGKLLKTLMLDMPGEEIVEPDEPRQSLAIRSQWGTLPFDVLSDGYRSTSQWVLDFVGWAIYDARLSHEREVEGIVLIDELEQHLHPRWQRRILYRLHQQFPRVQFIATTHAPMCVIGATDLKDDECRLIVLASDEGRVVAYADQGIPRGQRADQVLTSYLFGLSTSGDDSIREAVNRYAELQSKPKSRMSEPEKDEMDELETYLDKTIGSAESEFEQNVVDAVHGVLSKRVAPREEALSAERLATDWATLSTLRSIADSREE